MIINCNCL